MNTTRKGKIARLPQELREQLNRRLQNGELGRPLVDWLNSLPEVRAIVAAKFGGRPIREQNLSEWRKGGYCEWLMQTESVEVARQLAAEAGELTQAGGAISDKLAVLLAARYVVAARNLGRDGGKIDFNMLRALCNDVVALRRGDHDAARLEIERRRMDLIQSPWSPPAEPKATPRAGA